MSIIEAVGYGNYPILPKRLSYPELFQYNNNIHLFYNKDEDLLGKLIKIILDRPEKIYSSKRKQRHMLEAILETLNLKLV